MLLKVILLGIIQGITEFLPVSSTAHLVLAEKILGVSEESFGLAFDVSLHIGTTLALIIFFWDTWKNLLLSLTQNNILLRSPIRRTTEGQAKKKQKGTENRQLVLNLIIATIPAVLMGIFFEKDIMRIFRSPFWIAVFLILFSLVFYLAERSSKKNREIKQLGVIDAFIIGLNQAIALLPGVSRSGITISGGLLLNLKREEAGKFAFLLSTPIIVGAAIKEHANIFSKINSLSSDWWLFLIGVLTSFFIGYLTLKYFLKYLNKGSLMPFIIYRIILGIFILLLIY